MVVDQLQVLLPSNTHQNIRGAMGKIVPCLIRNLILKYHIDLLALLETRIGDESKAFCTFVVYGSPNPDIREGLWHELCHFSETIQHPWVVISDFNVYLHHLKKSSGVNRNHVCMERFQNCLSFCQLNYLGFKGPPFTLEGKGVKERVDRRVRNLSWQLAFPYALIIHLPSLKSNNKAFSKKILTNQDIINLFRFLASWLADVSFQDSWGHANVWVEVVSKFHENVDIWKKKLALAICSIERDEFLPNLKEKIDTCNICKKIFGKSMSQYYPKRNCIDCNTRFYHTSTIVRRKRNKIEALLDQRGGMILDQEVLKDIAKNHFQDLYKEEGEFPIIEECALEEVEKPSNDEIRSTIFSIDSFKAPKPDGLYLIFFQENWPTVGSFFCDTVRICYYEPDRIQEINSILLVLIPKCDAPTSLINFVLSIFAM
ncbi:hypothetical protein CR513_33772, partial [Mucuna pruriens]